MISTNKLLSTKEKEDATNIYHSFGEWNWKYTVGGTFKFNKRVVYYGSSELSLKFDDYSDEVLISGHLAPKGHTNWNKEKNISVNWYNYKIIDNKIYVFCYKNEFFVKRLAKNVDELIVKSDNSY